MIKEYISSKNIKYIKAPNLKFKFHFPMRELRASFMTIINTDSGLDERDVVNVQASLEKWEVEIEKLYFRLKVV
eukprot:snap_masked-scaffold_17-processed-gene-5.2-mRNA-1 protein AED:1.00 eAED:1.00 QI:0/0/0/0/1/1/2/0/73